MKLLVGSTPVALWRDIIHEAEAACTISLKQELEAYLVFLLMRYTDKPEVMRAIMASEFLNGVRHGRKQQELAFQEVGDKCLLFSGLFPHIAEKRLVKVSYFVDLGQSAYSNLSRKHSDLYGMLARHFVPLMDTLQAIRKYSKEYPDLLPLEAYELWNDSGSQRAYQVLSTHSKGVPFKFSKNQQ